MQTLYDGGANPATQTVLGFNKEQIVEYRNSIEKVSQDTRVNITDSIRDQIVIPVSTLWYQPDAVTYFEELKGEINKVAQEVTDIFNRYLDTVKSSAQSWAENTGAEVPALPSIENIEMSLDVSSIKPHDERNNIIINTTEVSNRIIARLPEIHQTILTNLNPLKDKLSADAAFLGAGQADVVEGCFNKVIELIGQTFEKISGGEGSIKMALEKAQKRAADAVTATLSNSGNFQ